VRRSEQPWKLLSPIRAAERFRPLHKFRGVESVRSIETGLKRCRRSSIKLRNTVHMQQLSTCHSNDRFSQQPLTAFESCFDFPDQCSTHKRIQRPKLFCRTNRRQRFLRRLSSCHVTASAHRFSIVSATTNHILNLIPLSGPTQHF
jgi:hypothetical protein